jgi:YesN/AraC family two-component response regulator
MKYNILIVDDDNDFRRQFKDCFEEYFVQEASSGEEAILQLKKPNKIDLVVLDVRMSGISGIEVIEEIRKSSPWVGIIILTGYSSKEVAIQALRKHVDDYIEKPFDVDAVKAVIKQVLNARNKGNDNDGNDQEDKIIQVKNFIQKNCLKKTGLIDAAKAVSLSPKYLSRIFKKHTGKGFNDYKLELKITKAKKLLAQTGCSIYQIADKVGYENAESFIRLFKRTMCCTPSEYRKKIKK